MPTVMENLETARSNMAARLAEITANPKPDYSIDGKSVSWSGYVSMLTDQMQRINALIQAEGGPQWLPTQAIP